MANEVPVEKLVKVYIKMRDKHTELLHAFQEQENALKEKMAKVKTALLDHCKEHNVESVRTAEGLFFRTIKQSYWTND
jgi:flagellar basal body-associated protein FliL